ncbi:MAG: hypothetical protein Q8K36_03445 [Alphaproteobacteria bacterium]|nr:hypothetical protein [Alphaproteobacteria bacterium]
MSTSISALPNQIRPINNKPNEKDEMEAFHAKQFKNEYNLARAKESFQEQEMNQTKIMAAMIRNQLPGDEVDPQKFNDSLMMMMNTRQMMGMSQLMDENNKLLKLSHNIGMGNFIDKEVKIDTQEFIHHGKGAQRFAYELPEACSNPVAEIFHISNQKNPVFSTDLDPQSPGGIVEWNGLDSEGKPLPYGEYIIKVGGHSATRKNLNDEPIPVEGKTSLFTVVDAVLTDPEGQDTFLVSNNMAINARDVQMIRNVNPYQHLNQKESQSTQTINEEV